MLLRLHDDNNKRVPFYLKNLGNAQVLCISASKRVPFGLCPLLVEIMLLMLKQLFLSLKVTPKCRYTPFNLRFVLFLCFLFFFLSFFPFMMEKDEKLVLTQNQMILTREQHAQYPFAGKNTQYPSIMSLK